MDDLLLDLFTAYFDARRNKRNTMNALGCLNYDLCDFYDEDDELKSGLIILIKEIPVQTIAFKPVQREVFAADFRDRIVHHLSEL
jgi:hypothetical protein